MAARRSTQKRRVAAFTAALAGAPVSSFGAPQANAQVDPMQAPPGVPTLSAAGSRAQGLSGATAVRKLSAAENAKAAALKFGGPIRDRLSLQHAQAREGHRFQILVQPDGTIIHQYGKDVPAADRQVVLRAAKRRTQLRSGPQGQGRSNDALRKPPTFTAY